MPASNTFTLDCINLDNNGCNDITIDAFGVKLTHRSGDPHSVNRLHISNPHMSVELLPSKGLSIGQVYYNDRPLFWEPPIGPHTPDDLNLLSDEIHINGSPAPGFTMLKTFMGGIELYGLQNWGMPRKDAQTGKLLPLHGETSNIPVDTVQIELSEQSLQISGSFTYYSMEGKDDKVWHKRGMPLYSITRTVQITNDGKVFTVVDCIENLTEETLYPDWGYHITFRAEENARLLVPSLEVEARGGGTLPEHIETWHRAKNDNVRSETGIIHRKLKPYKQNIEGVECTELLAQYPDNFGLHIIIPRTPYFQTWFCNGGAGSREFTYEDGSPVFSKNWDGMGIEIGASALDHDGNIEKMRNIGTAIQPGQRITIPMKFKVVSGESTKKIEANFTSYSGRR